MAQLVVVAGLLALGSACGDPPKPRDAASLGLPLVERPAEATRGATRAFLGAATGALTLTDAGGTPLRAVAGAPLLADDRIVLGPDGLAVLIFTNGNVLRLEGALEQEVQGLAGFDSKPVSGGLEAQLVAALSDRDRERLGAANERIGGWQLRLKALEAPAPELAAPPPAPDPAPDDDDDRESKTREEPEAMDAKEAPTEGDGAGDYAGGPPSELAGLGHKSTGSMGLGDGGGQGSGQGSKDKKEANTGPSGRPSKSEPDRGSGSSSNDSAPAKPGPKPDTRRPGAGEDDPPGAEEIEPETTVQGSVNTPLTLRGRTWITSGDQVPIATDLSRRIAACIQPIAGSHVIVELTVSSGTITAIIVRKKDSECIQDFLHETLPGVSGSGEIRLTFERD